MPNSVRDMIGFDLIERPKDAEGLGMGLLMSQMIVQTYGGELQVAQTDPRGTTMIIRLPIENKERILNNE